MNSFKVALLFAQFAVSREEYRKIGASNLAESNLRFVSLFTCQLSALRLFTASATDIAAVVVCAPGMYAGQTT